jgi:hypothetical protein
MAPGVKLSALAGVSRMQKDRSSNDPVSQFSASLKDRMASQNVDVTALSEATLIPAPRLREILDHPGTVRLAEIATLAVYFGTSLANFFY